MAIRMFFLEMLKTILSACGYSLIFLVGHNTNRLDRILEIQNITRPLATLLDKICENLYYDLVITIAYNSMYFWHSL